MKKPIPLLLGLLVVWITGLAYYQSKTSCSCDTLAAQNTIPNGVTKGLTLSDPARNFNVDLSNQLIFGVSLSTLSMPVSEATRSSLASIATFLRNNPDRVLMVKGLEGAQEQNLSGGESLAAARVETVRKLLIESGSLENQVQRDTAKGVIRTNDSPYFEGVELYFK
jgi:hypothetical protein